MMNLVYLARDTWFKYRSAFWKLKSLPKCREFADLYRQNEVHGCLEEILPAVLQHVIRASYRGCFNPSFILLLLLLLLKKRIKYQCRLFTISHSSYSCIVLLVGRFLVHRRSRSQSRVEPDRDSIFETMEIRSLWRQNFRDGKCTSYPMDTPL